MINTSPRSPDEQFEAHLLHLTQSAAAYPLWSPYRALLLLLVATFRGIKAALRQLAAHYREAGLEAAPEADRAAGKAAPLSPRQKSPRPRDAAEPAARTPRPPRPQAVPATAPQGQGQEALPVSGWAGKTPSPATPPAAPFHPPRCGPPIWPPRFSSRQKPAPWHAYFVTIL